MNTELDVERPGLDVDALATWLGDRLVSPPEESGSERDEVDHQVRRLSGDPFGHHHRRTEELS